LLKNVVSRAELQLQFHPESDGLSSLMFAQLGNLDKVLRSKPGNKTAQLTNLNKELRSTQGSKTGRMATFGEDKSKALLRHEKAQKDILDALSHDNTETLVTDELQFGGDDVTSVDAKPILYRPNIELFETVEKLDADVLLPCTVIAAVSSDCQFFGAERVQSGDQLIAIDAHRTMTLKTAQGYLEGKKGTVVTVSVSRAMPKSESDHTRVNIIRAKIVRTTVNAWLSWVESTILLQSAEAKKSEITERGQSENESFADTLCNQMLTRCEEIADKLQFQELFRLENVPIKHLPHRYRACNGLFSMLTSAAARIQSVYRAHIVRRSIVCNFTIRQSLEEKSKSTERILMTNGIATQMVVEWVNSGLLGSSPLQYCIENGHSEGLLQLIHYGFGTQSSWCDVLRKSTMFYSLMDSAVQNKAEKASLILLQELGMLPILENSTFTQAEKAEFVMNASIKFSAVDVMTSMIENPSVMQCLGEHSLQQKLRRVFAAFDDTTHPQESK
jgi:hypothetical protein